MAHEMRERRNMETPEQTEGRKMKETDRGQKNQGKTKYGHARAGRIQEKKRPIRRYQFGK